MSDKMDSIWDALRFARSASRHRISKRAITHVIVNYSVRFEQAPPPGGPASRSTRIVYLGEDLHGRRLEVMAVLGPDRELIVIHAMPLRRKYLTVYPEEDAG